MGTRLHNRPDPTSPYWLRRADQAVVAGLVSLALVLLLCYLIGQGGWFAGDDRRAIDIDQAPRQSARFEVDVNSADTVELSQLPGVGEELARRIVESRRREGRFDSIDELGRVRGLGEKTLARIRPHVRPIKPARPMARRPRHAGAKTAPAIPPGS